MSAFGPVTGQLHRRGLEETITEKVRGIGAVRGKLLATAKRVTSRGTPNLIQSARINHAHATRRSVLICNVQNRKRCVTRESRDWHCHQTDSATIGHIQKRRRINIRTIIKNPLQAELEASALAHNRASADEGNWL